MTKMTRRDFIGRSLMLGGSIMVMPACAPGRSDTADSRRRPNGWTPAYANLEAEGELVGRIEEAYRLFEACTLCPRACNVDRTKGGRGYCRAPTEPVISSYQPHFGEELPLVGRNGSGTIFFANCNLRCVFCQNWPIAHEGRGRQASDADLAGMMVGLQRRGCHNINLVTPTHVMPNILAAVRIALRHGGLRLPLVYNTGGYESAGIIERLEGIVDIYMPDLKFMDERSAGKYVNAADYPERARAAVREMYRQVGPLRIDEQGLAWRGLMIRHLVMPNQVAGTRALVEWVAETLGTDVYVNIMPQYRVDYQAYEYPAIARAITSEEFIEAMDWAEAAGLNRLDSRSVSQRDMHRRRSGRQAR